MIRDSTLNYGLVSITLHWLMALLLLGLFTVGLYMTDLGYYDSWYHRAPWWHKSIGLLFFMLLLIRLAWRIANVTPCDHDNHKQWERLLARFIHRVLYVLMLLICVSGYLIATVKGEGISIFGWFDLPALFTNLDDQKDLAGKTHLGLAVTLVVLVGLHALGAIKHHFIDRDDTLIRMIQPVIGKSSCGGSESGGIHRD
ncbi:MAG: cytochrome b [Gammaproteobacteria bacterium]|nr:cytochrome b [Gammaproteobacteria bacterium]